VPKLEWIMRYLSVAAAAAMTLLTVASAVHGQRPDSAIDARSLSWVAKGKAAQAAGNLDGASDAYESALAIDPRNREAFIGLGEIARVRDLPGKAIRFYREALELQPDDVAALKEQGEALVQQGAVERAKGNLTKLRTICGKKTCPEIAQLSATIAKGPPVVTASAKPAASETKN
jgi:tetratricopeptide (TPR) repeat protein